MDNELLMKAIGELSEDEIGTLLESLGAKRDEPAQDERPDPAKFADDVADRLVKKAQKEIPKAAPVQQAPQALPEFSQDEYAKLLVQDARKAQQYLEQTTYGGHVSQLVPYLAGTLANVVQEFNNFKAEMFAQRTPEYADPQTREVVNQILAERGWQPSAQSLEDALMIAKGRGLVSERESTLASRPTVPPRLPRGRGKEQPQFTEEMILERAGQMDDEALEDFLIKNGVIGQRHLT